MSLKDKMDAYLLRGALGSGYRARAGKLEKEKVEEEAPNLYARVDSYYDVAEGGGSVQVMFKFKGAEQWLRGAIQKTLGLKDRDLDDPLQPRYEIVGQGDWLNVTLSRPSAERFEEELIRYEAMQVKGSRNRF